MMQYNRWILGLFLPLLLACDNDRTIEGNYWICREGIYGEVYFKKDVMRAASEDEWAQLSEWRTIKVENDTLHYETFGEWRDSLKARLTYLPSNRIELSVIDDGYSVILEPIHEHLNWADSTAFWSGFNHRKAIHCNQVYYLQNPPTHEKINTPH